jgi:4'-phosphopantetheinyl transferase
MCCPLGEQLSEPSFNAHLSGLSPRECAHIQKFHHWQDRQRGLLGKLVLRRLLKAYGITQLDALCYDQYERPFQVQRSDVDFNIAHAGTWVVCGATDRGRIGVDVEHIRPIDLEIATHYFAAEEIDDLEQKDGHARLERFYHLWTLKEAYIKAKGNTFHTPLDQFRFDCTDPKTPRMHLKNQTDPHPWSFRSAFLDDHHIFSVCLPGRETLQGPEIVRDITALN